MCIWFEMKPKQESARLTEYLKFQTLFERKNENIFSPNEENAFFLSWKRISLFFKNEWKWLFSILFLSIDSIFIRQKPVELGNVWNTNQSGNENVIENKTHDGGTRSVVWSHSIEWLPSQTIWFSPVDIRMEFQLVHQFKKIQNNKIIKSSMPIASFQQNY